MNTSVDEINDSLTIFFITLLFLNKVIFVLSNNLSSVVRLEILLITTNLWLFSFDVIVISSLRLILNDLDVG